MQVEIRPLLLLPGSDVQVTEVEQSEKDSPPALTKKIGNSRFEIMLMMDKIRALYDGSWIKGKVHFAELKMGFLIHEVAHIKYNSWSCESHYLQNNELFRYVDHLLEDARIEYAMTLEHPSYARYLHWCLASVRDKLELELSGAVLEELDKYTSQLFFLSRFGAVLPDSDPAFINFCLPTLLQSQRSERFGEVIAAKAVTFWLQDWLEEQNANSPGADGGEGLPNENSVKGIRVAMTKADIAEIESSEVVANSNEMVIVVLDAERVQDTGDAEISLDGSVLNDMEDSASDPSGMSSAPGELIIVEKGNSFYRATLAKFEPVIEDMRQIWKRCFDRPMMAPAFEGDLNIKRQMDAYMNSMLGDEGEDFLVMKRLKKSLDLVVLRDISGSTMGIKNEYAESMIIFLASAEDVGEVRTASIDFSANHIVTKGFDDTLKGSRIYPRSETSTNMGSALDEIRKWNWRAKNRIVVIITDGGISDSRYCDKIKEELNTEANVRFISIDVREANVDNINYDASLVCCGVNQIPDVITRKVIGDII